MHSPCSFKDDLRLKKNVYYEVDYWAFLLILNLFNFCERAVLWHMLANSIFEMGCGQEFRLDFTSLVAISNFT